MLKTHAHNERGIFMVYGYCRVSTKTQLSGSSLAEQKAQILAKYPTAAIKNESMSGFGKRPVFERIIQKLSSGDILVVTKFDRFCRSTKEGLYYIDAIREKGASLHILNMGVIEDTPMGRMISTSLLAFAEFERAMIYERTQAGKAIARKKPGYHEGRPKKYTHEQEVLAVSLLEDHTYAQVTAMTGISRATLVRMKKRSAK